ncbi:helix-turn-helix transcriptional regulator [Leifsonia sp. ZF2019]|uniref:helix-turn-helix domain-containing protein n=1 Tax=Leifsonia sp. ZF2019 TaxID=2781978 RepID=UPI001CBB6C06|nr:helix-turn-helix transcriptional regulator [Leifsonia sp. ZF2019]UAJ80195.1 helix-turn-helix transcriptional regulator [Leifsonia sp. ZF2019]
MGTASRELGPLVEAVAAELRARRAYLNLGLRELADRARLPHPTVSKSLNGKRVIDVEELGRLAHALEIGPDVIMRDALANLKKRGFEIASYIPSLNNADAADLRRFGVKPRLSVVPHADTDLHSVDLSNDIDLAATEDGSHIDPSRGES